VCDALLGGALFSDRLRGEVEALEARLNASEGRLAVIGTNVLLEHLPPEQVTPEGATRRSFITSSGARC